MSRRDLREKKRREEASAAVTESFGIAKAAQEPHGGSIEIILAVVLAAAGLLTSWSGYQATLWSGEQDLSYNQTSNLRIEAARASARADLLRSVDVELFSAWLDAVASDEIILQQFYRNRFRPEFATAFEAWVAMRPIENPSAPPTPFVMPEYQLADQEQAEALEDRADAALAKARRDDRTADTYVQATVILATAMFLAGIAQVFKHRHAKVGLTVLSALICALGLARVIGLPALAL